MNRIFLLIFIFCVCVGSVMVWKYNASWISTDDAYVNAHIVQIASQVTGQVNRLNVVDNQEVRAGDVLFTLDPVIFLADLLHADAAVEHANAERSIAKITSERTLTLVKRRAASTQQGDIALAQLKSADANVALAEAVKKTAAVHLRFTEIIAPVNGWVTRLVLRVGDVVIAGQPVFALVSNEEFWVDANFRETDIEKIRVGQKVNVSVDMYSKHLFHGQVESISSGTGAAFSMLPPENATGNWVKVTQRIPVKIRIIDPDPEYPLRIGTSAKVTISMNH